MWDYTSDVVCSVFSVHAPSPPRNALVLLTISQYCNICVGLYKWCWDKPTHMISMFTCLLFEDLCSWYNFHNFLTDLRTQCLKYMIDIVYLLHMANSFFPLSNLCCWLIAFRRVLYCKNITSKSLPISSWKSNHQNSFGNETKKDCHWVEHTNFHSRIDEISLVSTNGWRDKDVKKPKEQEATNLMLTKD